MSPTPASRATFSSRQADHGRLLGRMVWPVSRRLPHPRPDRRGEPRQDRDRQAQRRRQPRRPPMKYQITSIPAMKVFEGRGRQDASSAPSRSRLSRPTSPSSWPRATRRSRATARPSGRGPSPSGARGSASFSDRLTLVRWKHVSTQGNNLDPWYTHYAERTAGPDRLRGARPVRRGLPARGRLARRRHALRLRPPAGARRRRHRAHRARPGRRRRCSTAPVRAYRSSASRSSR